MTGIVGQKWQSQSALPPGEFAGDNEFFMGSGVELWVMPGPSFIALNRIECVISRQQGAIVAQKKFSVVI